MIELYFNTLIETADDCHNPGVACYGCPHFDECQQHFDEDEE